MIKVQGNGWTAELNVSGDRTAMATTERHIESHVRIDLFATKNYKTGVWHTDAPFTYLTEMVGVRGIACIAEGPEATPVKPFEAVGIDEEEYQAEVDANMARFAAESAPAIEAPAQTFEQEITIALEAGDMEGFIAHQIERNSAQRRADKAAGKPTRPSFSRAFREVQGNPHAVTSAQDDPALWNLMQR